ncbi:MAG: uracil-DNA glycosylase family protein [Candidatus Aquicultorales bacterium]
MSDQTGLEDFEALRNEVLSCTKCDLSATRTNVVFGGPNLDADLMFIGEAPGRNEDEQGEPFVGAAGKLLTRLLWSIGLKRQDVFIGNVLKCRPPGNRDPKPEEIQVCKSFLIRQIQLIRPKVICTLGNFSTRLVLGKEVSISRVHGVEFKGKNSIVLPTYHPAAALYARTTMEALEADFQKVKEILERVEAPEEARSALVTEQLGLF